MPKKTARKDRSPEAGPVAATPEPDGTELLDRELSWLDFNARVLALAEDPAVPLLERLKFLAIFSANLDEFFMVRVAGLAGRVAAGLGAASAGGLEPAAQLKAIRARILELVADQTEIFAALVPTLAEAGIHLAGPGGIEPDHEEELRRRFEEQLFPVLTPLAVDPGHPFPYISNLSLNLAVMVRDGSDGERRFARVKVPPLLSRFQVSGDGTRLYPLEQLIGHSLPMLFPGMKVESWHPFRVTRNADLMVDDEEADDLLAAVEMQLRQRRFGRAVRLEVDAGMPAGVRQLLLRELQLGADDLYEITAGDTPVPPGSGLLDLGSLSELYAINRPEHKYPVRVPAVPVGLGADPVDFFATLRNRDVLVHHPYESFSAIQAFIDQAAHDPDVLAIKQTMYRTSLESAIPRALIRAAERGKQVAVLVELTARFSEEVNIAWAHRLEEAGVHVVYGLVGLKTGGKATLVVRRERGEPERPVQLPHRLQPPGRLPQARRGADAAPVAAPRADRGDGGRARRAHRHEDEQPRRRGDHRGPLRGLDGRLRGRPRDPGNLPAAARCPGPVGRHPRPFDRRPLPGALAGLRLRPRRHHPLLPRFRRPHAEQPRPAGATALPRRRPGAGGAAGGGPGRRAGRRGPGVGPGGQRFMDQSSGVKTLDINAFILPYRRLAFSLTCDRTKPTICPAGWDKQVVLGI
jgi:hypothetical protein